MKWRSILTISVLILLALIVSQDILARTYLNRSAVAYLRADNFDRNTVPPTAESEPSRTLVLAADRSHSVSVARGIGHLALLLGEAEFAQEVYSQIKDDYPTDWLLQRDILISLSLNDFPEEVLKRVQKYRRFESNVKDVDLRDAVAWSAWSLLQEDSTTPADRFDLLLFAQQARPDDLATNFEIWKVTNDPNSELKVRNFDGRAVEFSDQRLLDINLEKIPDILEGGLWTEDLAVRVLSYWVAIYPQNKMLSTQLEKLSSVYGDSLAWKTLRAELAYRSGDWKDAKARYLEIASHDTQYPLAYLFLGRICEQSPAICKTREQCQFFQDYNQAVPADVFGALKNAACNATAEAKDTLPTLVKGADNDLERAAALLGLSTEAIKLGNSLLADIGFDFSSLTETPVSWKATYTKSNPHFDPGGFAVTQDLLLTGDEVSAALIAGFWHGDHLSSRTRSMNGYQVWDSQNDRPFSLNMGLGGAYLLTFEYRTEAVPTVDEKVVFVSFGAGNSELQLFPTNGEWRRSKVVLCNSSAEITPISVVIFRSSLLGRVWIDNIQLREVTIDPRKSPRCDSFLLE